MQRAGHGTGPLVRGGMEATICLLLPSSGVKDSIIYTGAFEFRIRFLRTSGFSTCQNANIWGTQKTNKLIEYSFGRELYPTSWSVYVSVRRIMGVKCSVETLKCLEKSPPEPDPELFGLVIQFACNLIGYRLNPAGSWIIRTIGARIIEVCLYI